MVSNEVVIASLIAKRRAEIERRNQRVEQGIKTWLTIIALQIVVLVALTKVGVIY